MYDQKQQEEFLQKQKQSIALQKKKLDTERTKLNKDSAEAQLLEDQELRKQKLEEIETKRKSYHNRENKLNEKIVNIFWSENRFDGEIACVSKSPVGMEFKNWLRNEVESVVTAIKQTEE